MISILNYKLKMLSVIKAVLFDLDQTLIDLVKMKTEACKAAIKAMIKSGLKIDERTGYKKLMKIYFRVGIDSNIAFMKFLEEETGKADEKILQAGIDAYLKTKPSFLKPYPYVLEILEYLKSLNLKLGIVTDAPRTKAVQRLESIKIIHFFDLIVTFEDTEEEKPSDKPFRLAMEKLNLYPEEILFAGDSFMRDIRPAKKLGMKTLRIKRCEDLKKVKDLV
jgi:putative hydrolase of the HAD superfamily